MATTSTPRLIDSPQLRKLARRLTAWRATRRRGQRIPEALWRAATRLARIHGVSAISIALGLGYYELQRHLAAATATTGPGRADPAGPQFIPLAAPEPPCERGTLEVLKPCGQRLILRLAHSTSEEMVVLMQTFLRHHP